MKTSKSGKIWKQKPVSYQLVDEIKSACHYGKTLSLLLANRDFQPLEIPYFINPKIKNTLPDPYHLLDMGLAVQRVKEAIKKQQKIVILADYDVDGATASSLLYNFLTELRVEKKYIRIPDRIKDGYGPTIPLITKIIQEEADLLITLDCGTVAHEAMDFAKSKNLDVIVIDHHISLDTVKSAYAVVNPNRTDDNSEYTYLAAVGVTYLFIIALYMELKKETLRVNNINLLYYLDIVALGTVCDVVPLIGINRAFVSQGLKILASKTCNLGLSELMEVLGISDVQEYDTYYLGYVIGPVINAGGRVGESSLGANLLISDDRVKAKEIANRLLEFNIARKKLESFAVKGALEKAEVQKDNAFIIVEDKDWHQGIIGIVAGRLKDIYQKPVIVIAWIDEWNGKGSARSVKSIDIGEILLEAKGLNILINGGGHAMAGGLSINKEQYQEFYAYLYGRISYPKNKIDFFYDLEIQFEEISLEFVKEIDVLGPFGSMNSEPIFRINDLVLWSTKVVAGKHIGCVFRKENKYINAIAFNSYDNNIGEFLLSSPKRISITGKLKKNFWNGRFNVQLVILDIL